MRAIYTELCTGISSSKELFCRSRSSIVWSEISCLNFRAFWACHVLNYKLRQQRKVYPCVFSKSASSQVCQNSTPCGAKIQTAYFWPNNGRSAATKQFFWAWYACISKFQHALKLLNVLTSQRYDLIFKQKICKFESFSLWLKMLTFKFHTLYYCYFWL